MIDDENEEPCSRSTPLLDDQIPDVDAMYGVRVAASTLMLLVRNISWMPTQSLVVSELSENVEPC